MSTCDNLPPVKTSLTGIKPTHLPHLGNYLGAIRPALSLVEHYRTLYFIADTVYGWELWRTDGTAKGTEFADLVAGHLDLKCDEAQALLETLSVEERLHKVLIHIQKQISVLDVQEEIKSQVQEELGDRHREMFLRQQLKAIQKELGEDGGREDLEELGVRCVAGDIADPEAVSAAAEGCDAVVHTAGKAGVWGDAADYWKVNVEGTANVIQACREHGIEILVHTSSPSIVHTGGDIGGADESLPIADHFTAPYPASKAEAEKMVLAAGDSHLKCAALRPHLIWGPGDPHILPRLAEKARGGSLALPGPDKIIDTIFVENAAQAHVLALKELAGEARCAGKAYFISNGDPWPLKKITNGILGAAGLPHKDPDGHLLFVSADSGDFQSDP